LIDAATFEEHCRKLIDNRSYLLFTVDKLIHQLVRSLTSFIHDENTDTLLGMAISHSNEAQYLAEVGLMANTNIFGNLVFRFLQAGSIVYVTCFEHSMFHLPGSERSAEVGLWM
jgi:hypothetical protein